MSQDFIIHVKVQLVKHGKNQAWLASKLGISTAYMSDILNGRRNPSKKRAEIETVLDTLEKMEEAK